MVVFNGPLPNAFLIPAVQIKCSKVWSVSFGTRLALREASSHAQCATCVRYKLLVRKLSNDSTARAQQLKEFEWHLAKQFADRACYWQNRATARLPMAPEASGPTISIITDAIDHNKFRYPRTRLWSSKEFSSHQRPAMDCSCVLIHGRLLLFAISEPFVPKNSSWCAELICHSLHRIAFDCDLRRADIRLQSDNCSRETKNNTLFRLCGVLVGCRRVRRFQMDFLMTGHSHEDVDALFAVLSNAIEQRPEVHTPDAFLQLLQQWLSNDEVRPHEKTRAVLKVDQVRDWSFGSSNTVPHNHFVCCRV